MRDFRFWLLVALSFASSGALAQEGDPAFDQAREHFQRGVSLMQNENWEAALIELEQSLGLHETHSALFNAANCLKALHRYPDALRRFYDWQERYQGSGYDDEEAAVVAAVEELRGYLGLIVVVVDVAGAAVSVDGESVGTTPISEPISAQVGPHTVAVEASGYVPATREVTVVAGSVVRVEIQLEPAPVAEGPETPTPVATTDDGGVDQLWFWLTGSAAVACGVSAAITGGMGSATYDDFVGQPTYDADLAAEGESLELATNVLVGIASAAAVTAIVLAFFTDFGGDEAEPTPSGVAVSAIPNGLLVAW